MQSTVRNKTTQTHTKTYTKTGRQATAHQTNPAPSDTLLDILGPQRRGGLEKGVMPQR